MSNVFHSISNTETLSLKELKTLPFDAWKNILCSNINAGAHLSSLSLLPHQTLLAVLSDPQTKRILLGATTIEKSFPSLVSECPQTHYFERELFEQHGIEPIGHPFLKPIRNPLKMADKNLFYKVDGEEVHEVAVGPVHAGVIEPGHFRFQCHGETVLHLETALGYQHRGIEKEVQKGPNLRTPHYIETLSGDSSIGHITAYAQLLESIQHITPPPRAQAIRLIAAELERLANHVGDLGALSGDVGFLPTMSYCGRLRGDLLNLTALLCGNRFGRGLVRPGGVCFDLNQKTIQTLQTRLNNIESDVRSAIKLLLNTPSVLARFEETGIVTTNQAKEIGMVGPVARASGVTYDVRIHQPYGAYKQTKLQPQKETHGDCLARARVRWHEIQESFQMLFTLLDTLPKGPIAINFPTPLQPNQLAVALTEGWRGEICHLATTNETGHFASYKIIDPSFHNWFGLALALRNQEISDFPLCNKSFNLSYCGHDL